MSEIDRPNPDELLQAMTQQEERAARGRLKVFFGMSAGVPRRNMNG